jgi:hypothetical protein
MWLAAWRNDNIAHSTVRPDHAGRVDSHLVFVGKKTVIDSSADACSTGSEIVLTLLSPDD